MTFPENRVKTLKIKLATSSDDEIAEQYNVAKNQLESIHDCITGEHFYVRKLAGTNMVKNRLSISLT